MTELVWWLESSWVVHSSQIEGIETENVEFADSACSASSVAAICQAALCQAALCTATACLNWQLFVQRSFCEYSTMQLPLFNFLFSIFCSAALHPAATASAADTASLIQESQLFTRWYSSSNRSTDTRSLALSSYSSSIWYSSCRSVALSTAAQLIQQSYWMVMSTAVENGILTICQGYSFWKYQGVSWMAAAKEEAEMVMAVTKGMKTDETGYREDHDNRLKARRTWRG